MAGAAPGPYAPHRSARTPPGRVYTDPQRFDQEMERLFFANWLAVGSSSEFAERNRFWMREVAAESVLLARDRAGELRAFYNVCRHRGARLVDGPPTTDGGPIVCAYHGWTYGLDGRLLGARDTDDLPGFRVDDQGLVPLHVAEEGGLVWIHFAAEPAPLAASFGPILSRWGGVHGMVRGARREYSVAANWKIVVENFAECYHCAPVHPTLNRITPYRSGANDAWFARGARGEFAGGYMELVDGCDSLVRGGRTSRPPLASRRAEDRRRIYYYVLFPNLFLSFAPDYTMLHRVDPLAPGRSRVENEFYFDATTAALPNFDARDVVELWDEINRQDWRVCELAQAGARSRSWHGGRYSDTESMVCDFDRTIAERMGDPDPWSGGPPRRAP